MVLISLCLQQFVYLFLYVSAVACTHFFAFVGMNTHFSASAKHVDTFNCNTCTYFSALMHLLLCFCQSSIYTVGSEGCGRFCCRRIRLDCFSLTYFPHVFLSIISSFFHKCSCSLRMVKRHKCRGILPCWVFLHYDVLDFLISAKCSKLALWIL